MPLRGSMAWGTSLRTSLLFLPPVGTQDGKSSLRRQLRWCFTAFLGTHRLPKLRSSSSPWLGLRHLADLHKYRAMCYFRADVPVFQKKEKGDVPPECGPLRVSGPYSDSGNNREEETQ